MYPFANKLVELANRLWVNSLPINDLLLAAYLKVGRHYKEGEVCLQLLQVEKRLMSLNCHYFGVLSQMLICFSWRDSSLVNGRFPRIKFPASTKLIPR